MSTRSSTAATTASSLRDRRVRSNTTARSAGATPPNGTLQLLEWMAEDGLLDRVVLGMDAARRGLLPRCTVGARPHLAARRLLGGDGGARARTDDARRRLFVDEPGSGVRVRDASTEGESHDRALAHQRRRLARPAVVVRRRHRRRGARRVRTGDLAEMLDDAVDLALRDQEEAGIDIVSDGEMRRAGFFTAEFYRHLTGVRALPADRRLGAGGHDQQHRFEVLEPIAAPDGLGVVAEYRYAVEPGDAGRSR